MPKGFLPNADAALLDWSRNFAARLSESGERYGISPAQAADYALKNAAFADAYHLVADPTTRTRPNVLAKNDVRAALRAAARRLALIIKSQAVTDDERIALGLSPRNAGRAAPVARPAAAPLVGIRGVTGRTIRLRLCATDPPRRGRPPGVLGAVLFSYALPPAPLAAAPAAVPPADLAEWRFAGHATRTVVDVTFPADLPPGTEVWLTARWLNPRLQPGPAARPVSTHLGGGCSLDTNLRLAA
jgi:hypothetical protein